MSDVDLFGFEQTPAKRTNARIYHLFMILYRHLQQCCINTMERIEMNVQEPFVMSCAEFAHLNQVKSPSVRARLQKTGSYFGVIPARLANGRLAFPATLVTLKKGNIENGNI